MYCSKCSRVKTCHVVVFKKLLGASHTSYIVTFSYDKLKKISKKNSIKKSDI